MKLGIRRLLIAAIAVTVIAFFTAGLTGNDQTGARAVIGDIAWGTFLIGSLVVLVLAVTTLVQGALRRRQPRDLA